MINHIAERRGSELSMQITERGTADTSKEKAPVNPVSGTRVDEHPDGG
jgi:hypothetical protein